MGLLTDASGAPAISTFGPFALEAGTTDVVIAEADGDSDEDIVTISPRMGGTGLLTLSRWDGGGSVVAHTSIVLPAVPTELASFDVDGDGTAELFVLTEGGLLVYPLRCPP